MKLDRTVIVAIKDRVRMSDLVRADGIELVAEAGQLKGACPFHKDDTPSLFVDDDKDGGVFRCHGCGTGGDVFVWVQKRQDLPFKEALEQLAAKAGVEVKAPAGPRRMVAEYRYTDSVGQLLYTVERWEPGKNGRSKDFVQRLADGTPGKSPVQVLYGLQRLAENPDAPVFVVEGEKCADALNAAGLVAVTHAGGASATKTWTREFAEFLGGRRIYLLPDNDEPGDKLMAHVAKIIPSATTLRLEHKHKGDDAFDWLEDGHTAAELLALAASPPAQAGWEAELLCTRTKEIRTTIGNAMIVLEHNPAFAGALFFDERTLQACASRPLPWDRPGTRVPRPLADDDAVFFARFMEHTYEAAFSSEICGRALWAHAGLDRRDALRSFLEALTWDKTERTADWLIKHAGAPDTPFVRAASRAWLISAVARALQPGCKVDHVLILEGGQGLKKSTLLASLAGESFFTDHIPDVDSKDTAMILGRSWIIELAELESMRKSEVTQLKSFITRRSDIFRPPYGRAVIEVPRRCVFAASTNEESYLRDPTGNRRFWPVRVTLDDAAGLADIRDQLWAEAVELYRTGERWWFEDREIIAAAHEEQQAREQVDPWHDLVMAAVDGRAHTTTTDVLSAIGVDKARRSNADAQRVAWVLRQAGWTRARVQQRGGRDWRYYPPGHLHLAESVPGPPALRNLGHHLGQQNPNENNSVSQVSQVASDSQDFREGEIVDTDDIPWGGN
jgi:predicted P-loop ATPase/5S rRNA maturation endonuclease (ribonuclease M5)